MSQTATIPENPPSNSTGNPTLATALGTLELDLDSELRRYRRQAIAKGQHPDVANSPVLRAVSIAESEHIVDVLADQLAGEGAEPQHLATVSLPTPENPTAAHSPEVQQALEALQTRTGDADKELLNLEDREALPQEYLNSSEELLKTLKQDKTDPQTQATSAKTSQSQPKNLAWLLGGFGGLAIAGIFGAIFLPNIWQGSEQPQTAQDRNEAVIASADSTNETALATAPKTVNLASEAFPDLSLSNLSVINPNEEVAIAPTPAQPAEVTPPTAVPEPLVSPTGREDLASALLPPSLRPQPINPFPLTPQTSTLTPTQGQNQTLATPDGLKVGFHYVVYRNTSADGLQRAQGEVPDAFIRSFPIGRAVQLAEIADAASAESLTKKLNEAKIAAEIYHHQLTPTQ